MFYNSSNSYGFNECVAHGACSIPPSISSMQEIMFIILRQIAYYLLKLNKLKRKNNKILGDLIEELAFIDGVRDLSERQILEKFYKQYLNLVEVRNDYLEAASLNKSRVYDVNNLFKFSADTNLSNILRLGDKEFINKYKGLNTNDKYYAEILSAVLKSVCVNWVNLREYGLKCRYVSNNILEALNIFNFKKVSIKKIKFYINDLAKCDEFLLKLLNKVETKKFGKVDYVEVSTSTKPNKAILVSGSNLNDLKSLLNGLKDENIDVYTNGNLLVAHSYPYFRKFVNLKGHFGTGVNNTILDFATFPGAVLLTKNEAQNIEYLYRGRLFSTDDCAPKGVVKIETNDFSQLIKSAKQAKGFAKGRVKKPEFVGVDVNSLVDWIKNIKSKNYKKIFIIGPSVLTLSQRDYFKKMFSQMPEDICAISFAYDPHKDNVKYINIGNSYPILYGVLSIIFEYIPIYSENLVFFLTKCDINSLSNIINLKNKGAKHIYLSDCPPLVINPAVLSAFRNLYDVRDLVIKKGEP